jgi:DNA-binding transcriptional LysR family regulator
VTLNSTEMAICLAVQGAALIYVAEPSIAGELKAGELLTVLDEWAPMGPALHIYYPSRRQVPMGLRLLTDLIRQMRPLGY